MGCADHDMTMNRLGELAHMASALAGQVDGLKADLKRIIPRPVNWYQYQASATIIDTRSYPIQTSEPILVHRIKVTVSSPATLTMLGMQGTVIFQLSPGTPDLIFSEAPGSGFLIRSTDTFVLSQTSAGTLMLMVIGEELPAANMW